MRVLTSAQRRHFDEEGYVVVKDVLDPNRDMAPLMAEYKDVLGGIAASLLAKGAVRSTYRDWWFPAVAPTTLASGAYNVPDLLLFTR